VAKELRERMILNSCILATELFGEGGSFHVAPWTDFKRYLRSARKSINFGSLIAAMPWPMRSAPRNSMASRISPAADFAGVHQLVQAISRRDRRQGEIPQLDAELIAAMPKATIAFEWQRSRIPRLPSRRLRRTGGQHRTPSGTGGHCFRRFGGANQRFKVSFRALLAQEHHADGKSYFRIDTFCVSNAWQGRGRLAHSLRVA